MLVISLCISWCVFESLPVVAIYIAAVKGWVASGLETVLHVKGTQATPVEGHKVMCI